MKNDRKRLLFVATKKTVHNGYGFAKGELVDVTHINIEVGVRSLVRVVDMYGNSHTMKFETFNRNFAYDCII